MKARWSALALPLALLTVGCGTRVVQLNPPGDAGPQKCGDYLREDGVTCHLCFSPDGGVTVASCPQAMATMDASSGATMPVPQICKVTVTGDDRCASCAMGLICLKCDVPVATSAGGYCRVCIWSDNPMQRCLQCYGDDKVRREDTCDGLRKETLLYPADGGA